MGIGPQATERTRTVKPVLGFMGLGWIGRDRMEAMIREA